MSKLSIVPGHKVPVIHATTTREPIIPARRSGLNAAGQPQLKQQAAIRNPQAREQV
jgi:hypothetical protein